MDRPRLEGKELEERILARQDELELIRDAATRDNPVCGGYIVLREIAEAQGLFVNQALDLSDDDDDERPF